MSDTPSIPANWYDDPEDATRLRYWDGTAWTEHYSPKPGVAAPAAPPAYGAAPAYGTTPAYGQAAYGAAVQHPVTAVSPVPLMIAGGLLVVSGIARLVTTLAPYHQVGNAAGAALESLAIIGAFGAFLAAGYPHRRTAARVLSFSLIGVYLVAMLLVLGGTLTFNLALLGLAAFLGLVVLGLGIAFATVAFRTPGLQRRVAVLPLVLYLGLLAFGLMNGAANGTGNYGATIGLLAVSSLVPITVGVLFIVFGRTPHTADANPVGTA